MKNAFRSNLDKSVGTSNGKETGRIATPPFNYRNTAMGLLAAGSRAISAPAAPLIMPNINLQQLLLKNEEIDSPDSVGTCSGGWNTPTPPLRQAIFSSFKNRPLAFPQTDETIPVKPLKTSNLNQLLSSTPPSPAKSVRSSSNASYRSRPEDAKKGDETNAKIMQTSDYDNVNPEVEYAVYF